MAKTRSPTPLPYGHILRQATVHFVEEVLQTGQSHTSGLFGEMHLQLTFKVGNGDDTDIDSVLKKICDALLVSAIGGSIALQCLCARCRIAAFMWQPP